MGIVDPWAIGYNCVCSMGDGQLPIYMRVIDGQKRVAPIDLGAGELSPPYVLRIFRQFGFGDEEIEAPVHSNQEAR